MLEVGSTERGSRGGGSARVTVNAISPPEGSASPPSPRRNRLAKTTSAKVADRWVGGQPEGDEQCSRLAEDERTSTVRAICRGEPGLTRDRLARGLRLCHGMDDAEKLRDWPSGNVSAGIRLACLNRASLGGSGNSRSNRGATGEFPPRCQRTTVS
jgi:hypothetical protein